MTAPERIRNHPEFDPAWDVFRDAEGNPVTVTWQQVQAIWHAMGVVQSVRDHERHRDEAREPGLVLPGNRSILFSHAEYQKSRLLGRMLIDGLPPTRTRPPNEWSGPAWESLPDGDPFREPKP